MYVINLASIFAMYAPIRTCPSSLPGKAPSVCEWSQCLQLLARQLCLGPYQCCHHRHNCMDCFCCIPSGWVQRKCFRNCVLLDGKCMYMYTREPILYVLVPFLAVHLLGWYSHYLLPFLHLQKSPAGLWSPLHPLLLPPTGRALCARPSCVSESR